MFFILLCILIAVLLGTKHQPDASGWMMLIGLAWLAGFLDCRLFARHDRDRERTLPPDANEPSDDRVTF